MTNKLPTIWFWQRLRTPHMSMLAEALAENGYNVIYVSNEFLSKYRKKQGWETPKLNKTIFKLAKNKEEVVSLASTVKKNSIHLCQGLRGNFLVNDAQHVLRKRGIKHWIMMEKVDDSGPKGFVKRIIYSMLFFYWKPFLHGILAIGQGTQSWVIDRGVKNKIVYPFAYFLKKPIVKRLYKNKDNSLNRSNYRFIFVGQLIKRKKVDLLIDCISSLNINNIELWIVGDGPEKENLYSRAKLSLQNQITWLGTVQMSKIPNIMNQADCLVLPSKHDGWGAVASEALMLGIPVICSSSCGASSIVKSSGFGGVFFSNNKNSLKKKLIKQYKNGKLDVKTKKKIIKWSSCISNYKGAEYLADIILKKNVFIKKPPWVK